ncbi:MULTISPECIES: hypothetical protein [Nocardiopsidaceae]|uniref:Uncharacterized protein n=1 Tax=Streptomonospora nanhaiensis TaxID=1323731 RepID=A0ABY6YHK6_9ACTN|nr:hypothetical protein [Streptomonospora nanhaiensis]WAE71694.1 hypothetical protein OUQ99_20975 [Streptomonospora nanhaiensis]
MNRKTVTRLAFAAIVAPALAFGAPAAAMADSFFAAGMSEAGPHGASQAGVIAGATSGHGSDHEDGKGGKGGSFYIKKWNEAGPHGASEGGVVSAAG